MESTVIDNTELALDVPEKTEEQEPISKEKKLVKEIIEIRGDDSCGACNDLEDMINNDFSKRSNVPIEISKSEASDEQKKAGVPQSKICKVFDDGSQECSDVILGADKEELSSKLDLKEEVKESEKEEPQNPQDSSDLETVESKE